MTKKGMIGPVWTKAIDEPRFKKILNKGVREFKDNRPEILEMIKKGIEEKGWFQIRYGPEFIRESYVLAKKSEDLFIKEVDDYDCSSGEFFFDVNLQLFWRYTGSFD